MPGLLGMISAADQMAEAGLTCDAMPLCHVTKCTSRCKSEFRYGGGLLNPYRKRGRTPTISASSAATKTIKIFYNHLRIAREYPLQQFYREKIRIFLCART